MVKKYNAVFAITITKTELESSGVYNVQHQWRGLAASDCMRLYMPGMGMILWGESPLYIIWDVIIDESYKKY